MSAPRLLLLENDPSDVEAIQAMLMDRNMDYELLRVETRADFVTALETDAFDLILANCALPDFDGSAVLERAYALCPEIPLIILAPSLDEERAIALLNQGATDYILKPQLGRLVLAVKQALRETAERRKQQTMLRDRNRSVRMLREQNQLLQLVALGHPLDECLAAVCASVAQLSPCTRACFLLTDPQRQTFPRAITPDFPPSFGQGLKDAPINERAISTCGTAVDCGEPVTCANIAHDKHWSKGWRDLCIAHGILACYSTPMIGLDTLPVGSLMLCFDEARLPTEWEYQLAEFGAQVASIVFERDRTTHALRESEEQSRNILESITDAFFGLDENWQFIYVNQSAEILLNRAPVDLIGKKIWEEYPGLTSSKFETIYRGVMRDRIPGALTEYYPDHDRWYEVHVYPAKNGISVYFRNATDLIQAAETLRQTSAALEQQVQKFEAVKSSVPDFIYTFDLAGRFIDVNQPLLDLWQKTLAEAIGKNFFELEYPVDLAAKLQNQIQEVIQTRQSIRDETPYTSAIGTRDYEYIFVPIFNAENAVEMVAGVTRDITDRKATEAELRESEVRFRTLADNMSQFAWMADPNGWIFWYNHRWFEYTGTTLEEMQGWGWQQVHHPDHVDRVVEYFRHCIETGEPWEDTFPLRSKDGSYRWFLSRAIPIKDEADRIAHWFGTNTDISDRKQIEAELRQKNAILDVVNESVPTPIFVKDRQGRIIYANPATLEVLGKSAEEVIGCYDSDLYPSPEDAARVMENDQRIMETGQTEVVEESPDGIRTFLGMKAPYRNEAGEVIGLVGISNDISDRKRIEAEREQLLQQEQAAREAAEQANRIKDEFLAVVSHELRTPLNPILGWSKLLRSGKLSPEKAAAALGTIERNAQQQAQLIDDLLDISRILQNKLTLEIAPVDLVATVTDAFETVRLTAEAKSIQLRSSLAADVDPIMGDASRLQQIVWNLLSNAIKFTPENGQVEVRLERVQGAMNDAETRSRSVSVASASRRVGVNLKPETYYPYAQITVRDTGKGILPEFLPHLFEAFRQEDATTTRKFGGLGLGLSIVQQLTILHRGTITAASDGEGKGATFTVQFPIAPRQPTSPARSSSDRPPMDLSGIQILVVDDIIDSQEFVVFALEQAGAIVTPASSAQMALELLAHVQPDIVISDLGMPDCNGYELLQQIRSDFIRLQSIPAIALSAYASKTDQEQALTAGFQCHLAKPIDPESLIKTVAMLIQPPK